MQRLIDIVLGIVTLLLLAPLMGLVALLVAWRLGRPALFTQARPGLYGRPFRLIKFRTMTDRRDAEGNLLPDEARLTPFGRFLRSTSLDELPEIFNVLKGEMSLVGPRPLLMEYLRLYTPEQNRRHLVKPGITGWAQINGRNALSWEERFDLDVWYVDNRSTLLDLHILWRTLVQVLRRDGISAAGHVTMPDFTGTDDKAGRSAPLAPAREPGRCAP